MDPFPEATGREATDEESVDEPEPDDVTASPDTEDDETTRTSDEAHVCDPDSPVPCQFH